MAATLFDHLNAIYTDQRVEYFDTLEPEDAKSYSAYMINRLLSMNAGYISVVNTFQLYLNTVGPRESYLFYSQLIPKGKQFNKYIKAQSKVKYELWLIDFIAQYYTISRRDATEYLHIYYASDTNKAELKALLEAHNTHSKFIKQADL